MIKESIYKRYKPSIIPPLHKGQDTLWFIFDDSKLFLQVSQEKAFVPKTKDLEEWGLKIESELYLGTLDDHPCFVGQLVHYESLPNQMHLKELRSLFELMDESEFLLAGRALQILNWYKTHLFCGKCGKPTNDKADERAKVCSSCGDIRYPTISPAIIVAVEKGDAILLAHGANFANDMYSVIAGFVEPGETLEDCVRREVNEEIGIDVNNIKYFGSQSWPFPNSLMIAFTAEYAGGDILVDHLEIENAGWFNVHNLPQIPTNISISRSLINQFINKHKV